MKTIQLQVAVSKSHIMHLSILLSQRENGDTSVNKDFLDMFLLVCVSACQKVCYTIILRNKLEIRIHTCKRVVVGIIGRGNVKRHTRFSKMGDRMTIINVHQKQF